MRALRSGILRSCGLDWHRAGQPLLLARQLAGHLPRAAVDTVAQVTSSETTAAAQQPSTAYPFADIEAKWQQYWEDNQTFRTPEDVDTSKPKYYVLDMFPYPR